MMSFIAFFILITYSSILIMFTSFFVIRMIYFINKGKDPKSALKIYSPDIKEKEPFRIG